VTGPEDHIIKEIKSGKESAFEYLFHEYYRPLTVFAISYTGNLQVAKDLVQDFFVHLYERRARIEIRTSLKSYLFQSVRNRCLNHLKAEKGHHAHLEIIKAGTEPSEDLEAEIRATELQQQVAGLIEKLPPECRSIFIMSRIEGLDNKSIALKKGISKRTVETQISKALKAIREKIS